ncbi:hypothetical protein LBMAG15_09810 [Actinomycetes bacterium]|nr:hypothetical protein LBMAG15_09810 [Actinomycetes bacterium]
MINLRKLRTGAPAQFIRRHRRALAATCAALAVLTALGSVRSAGDLPATEAAHSITTLDPGERAIPVPLSPPAAAGLLHLGDVIDVIAISDSGTASTVARGALVTGVPAAGGFMSSASAIVVVAVDELTALRIAGATGTGDLTFALHPTSPR